MRTLRLTIKKRWFNLLISGRKKEEYREIKPYWVRRLVSGPLDYPGLVDELCGALSHYPNPVYFRDVLSKYGCDLREFDAVEFTNGYSKNSPKVTFEFIWLDIGHGTPLFGAPDHPVFRIALGAEISRENQKQ